MAKDKMAVPLFATLPVVLPAIASYKAVGFSTALPEYMLWQTTGYSMSDSAFNKTIVVRQASLVVLSYVGHRLANRLGINRAIRKLTGGAVQL